MNENGENMDGSKVQFGDLGAIINNIRYYKTFIDKNRNNFIVIFWCKTIDMRGKHAKRRSPTMSCTLK
jgi:hypothetical protein